VRQGRVEARDLSLRPYICTMFPAAYLSKKLDRPLPTKDGGTLRTIGDACDYMLALPEHRETRLHWQHAGKLLLEEADVGKFSRQLELALFLDYQLDLAALTHEEATPLPAARL
jgi:hypothetical protein